MAAELLWLQNKVPTYLQMQKEKKILQFFELLYPKWFSSFPEHLRVWPREPSQNSPDKDTKINESGLDLANDEVNTELDHENSKLREWFQNNTKGKTTPGGTSTSKILSTLLGQRARGTRDLNEVEVYSQIHYESKVKPLVSDNIKENNLVLPDQKLHAIRQHTSECFANESEDVKDEVQDETVQINAARKLGSVALMPFGSAIQELPIVLGQIFEELSTLMGDIMTLRSVLLAISFAIVNSSSFVSYHHGKSLEGLSFKTLTPNFHEQYLLPFEKHLGRIYGPSVKGTSVPASASSSPPPSTVNLNSPSAPSAPPPLTTDFISTSAPSAPPLLTMDLSTSTPNQPSDQSSAHLLQGQEFNTSGLVLDPPQWNGWQSHLDPNPSYMSSMAPASLITAWRRDYGFNRNATMSGTLTSAIMQPQLPNSNALPTHGLPLTGTIPLLHQHSLLVSLPEPTLLVSLPEPALPVSLPEPALPVSLPNHVLLVSLPEPALSISSPQTVQPVSLPQPALPLEPDQVMLAHNSKPLTSSKHTITTQARCSGCPECPST
ncbi:hypothetical protein BDR06DRAFT_1014254 [Suillus hirtellus]|nr:hypothetical protein BDR06DRAFT_1014254 [Suillus hirtellus]